MNIIRWEPFTGMNDAFNFSRFPSLFGRWPLSPGDGESSPQWSPPVDISETGQEYLIRAALPAVKKEDVEVTFAEGMLTLSGERCQKEEQGNEKFHRVESFYGKFSRSFALPEAIDAGAIRAESKDGVLIVHVPKTKAEAKKPTTIKVQ
jgi:HSP20 family protein